MCGISAILGPDVDPQRLERMVASQNHRGPNHNAISLDPSGMAGLGHNRLSIIDLSPNAHQPMTSADGRYVIVLNGEVYNYLELRAQLTDYPYRTSSDTEVILAAYMHWGVDCLHHLIGMFSFLIWDTVEKNLFAARDRFGVKPLYYAQIANGSLYIASEIKAIRSAGFSTRPDSATWATYLASGGYDNSAHTFWDGIFSLPGGCAFVWQDYKLDIWRWYDFKTRTQEIDARSEEEVREEYLALLRETVMLRFRSDVPVGINLSGGLDSSTLLSTVQTVQGSSGNAMAFTFVTGDPQYDELPWVEEMLRHTHHSLVACSLNAAQVPDLAEEIQHFQDEPFGGIPTLAYAKVFEAARSRDIIVLLDGQGMDEQWAGYDYYRSAGVGDATIIQGSHEKPTRPGCLQPEFSALARVITPEQPYPDRLRNLQYRDAFYTKIPRALRFNDRISMRASTELREPFLDHRLFELAFRQPEARKINAETGKVFLRKIISPYMPANVSLAPKRALQTPQREWLRGPLRGWATEMIASAQKAAPGWLDAQAVDGEWQRFCQGQGDNSFFIWQWISLGLLLHC